VRCHPRSQQTAPNSNSAWSSGQLEVEEGEKQGIGQKQVSIMDLKFAIWVYLFTHFPHKL
jgi:hypothetical protein